MEKPGILSRAADRLKNQPTLLERKREKEVKEGTAKRKQRAGRKTQLFGN